MSALAASATTLSRVGDQPWADEFYLAGSSALADHLGHRPTRDLDLMSRTNRLRSPDRRDILFPWLEVAPATRVETARDGFLDLRLEDSTALRFYYYPYPLVSEGVRRHGVAIASLVDLALMKLGAIISRGTKRDFVDLYFISRRQPLEEILARAPSKFSAVHDFGLQALKGLSDRTEAAGEPMPMLNEDLDWETVVDWVETEVRMLARAVVELPRTGR